MKRKKAFCMGLLLSMALLLCTAAGFYFDVHQPAAFPSDTWGMLLIDIAEQDAATFYHVDTLGVYVLTVDEKSMAYHAGVRPGDRLVSINGIAVQSASEWSDLPAGEVTLQLERSPGESLNLSLKIEDENKDGGDSASADCG